MNEVKNILEVKDLEVVYETDLEIVHAVNGISFLVKEGETVGLVGETGAGKSTTALSILRLLAENTGKIRNGSICFDGEDIMEMDTLALQKMRGKDISMIFQDPMTSLNPVLTVGAQIGEVLKLHNSKLSSHEIEEYVDKMLRLVGIPTERKSEYPHQFSGGMKQRVVIAIALACEPRLLIADEPTTALDVTIQAQVLNLMMDFQDEFGLTYMFITHDLSVVKHISDEIMVMYLGQCVERASSKELFANPMHPYTKALLSAVPIPSLAKRGKPRDILSGEVVSPIDPAPGCRFAARCKYATEKCKDPVQFQQVSEGHFLACKRFEE